MRAWVLRIGCMAAAGVLPLLAGVPVAILLLLLVPVAAECCREADERLACGGAMAALCMACWYLLPGAAGAVALVWCIAAGGMLLNRERNAIRRGLTWAGIGMVILCMASVMLAQRYQGDLCEGLAGDMVNALAQRKDAGKVLLQCYQMGLCRLEDDMSVVVRLLGPLAVNGGVKREMLYSLRSTLADSLNALVPQAVMAWLMLTALLAAAVPDVVRRRMGLPGKLTPFGEWQLTNGVLGHLNVLVVIYLAVLLTDQPVLVMLGRLCGAAFQYTYMIFGLAVMEGISKRHGMARLVRRIWMAACILFAPFILLILGVVDHRLDLRRLRHSTDDKGGI